MSSYASLEQVRQYLGNTDASKATNDGLLTRLIGAASTAIDNACQRSFAATTATRSYSRFYDGVKGYALYLDADLLTVTSLTNANDQAIPVDGSGYWLEPRNSPPYNIIRLKSSYVWVFNVDGEIAVTGTWGYSATPPDDIVQATIRLAAFLYRQKDSNSDIDRALVMPGGPVVMPGAMPKDVLQLITPYRRGGLR